MLKIDATIGYNNSLTTIKKVFLKAKLLGYREETARESQLLFLPLLEKLVHYPA